MHISRRQFLGGVAAASAAQVARIRSSGARGLLVDPLVDEVVGRGLAAARKAGATYADVRVHRRRNESIYAREDHVVGTGAGERYGVGVRVIAGGAWGFAASARVDAKTVEQLAALAVDIAKANA